MKLKELILLSCITVTPGKAHAFDLTQVVQDIVQKNQPIPDAGIAIAIIQKGEIVFESGFGKRDRRNNLPVDTKTLFAVGSTTKALTSTLISQHAHDGILNLEVPVNRLANNFHLQLQDESVTDAITLTDMLSHRSGFPRHDMLIFLTPFGTQEIFRRMRFLTFNSAPGMGFREGWQYNNLMYMAAGALSARVANRSWEALTQEKLLSPLGMESANFSLKKMTDTGNYAHGYLGTQEQKLFDLKKVAPAGALNASVKDMALWIQMQLNHGLNRSGHRVVSAEALAATYMPRVDIPKEFYPYLLPGQHWRYGLGWFVGESNGERVLAHGGNVIGTTSLVSFMPEKNLGLVILINQTASSFPAKAAGEIYSYLLSEDEKFASSDLSRFLTTPMELDRYEATQFVSPIYGTHSARSFDCRGSFINHGYGRLSVASIERDVRISYYDYSWRVSLNDQNRFTLPINTFGPSIGIAGQILFNRSKKCWAVEVQFESSTDPIRFLHAPNLSQSHKLHSRSKVAG